MKVFTLAEFIEVTGLCEERASEFLLWFEQVGLVERKLRSGWAVTSRGRALSRELTLATPDPAAA